MTPKHRYQVMPEPPPEEYAACKADIITDGVRIPIEVDEEGNIIDGHQRITTCSHEENSRH